MTVEELRDLLERSQPMIVDDGGRLLSEEEAQRLPEGAGIRTKPQTWARVA